MSGAPEGRGRILKTMKALGIGRVVVGVVTVVAVLVAAIIALRPSAHNSQASAQIARTVAAKTAFAPVTPFATITPLPTPDTRPRILDVASGSISLLKLEPGFAFEHLMSDGSVLAGNGSGKLEAVTRGGSIVARVTNDGEPAPVYSDDDRYAIWLSDGHLRSYDAQTRATGATVPAGAKFPQQLRDGSVVLCATRLCTASALVRPDGTVASTFDVPERVGVAIFPDAQRMAWPADDGMHVYDAGSGTERTYPGVHWVVGEIAVSPDAAYLAYGRLTGDEAVHVQLLDLRTGGERQLYAGAPKARVDGLTFTNNRRLTFDVSADPTRPDEQSTIYAYEIDGTRLRTMPSARSWASCGPACGLPPPDSIGPGGIAFWCAPPGPGADQSAGCITHLVAVDRAAGTMRDVFVGPRRESYAVSPDETMLAVIGPNLTLHLIRIVDGSDRTYTIDTQIAFADVLWFPDGSAVLITGSSGV